eukprot:12305961-Ditylum_brightwellii.AAC.1
MLRFQGPCDSSPVLMPSYRTKLAGILVTLYFLNALCNYSQQQVLVQLPLYCDNAAAVLTANLPTRSGLKAHLCADYNIAAKVRKKASVPNLNFSWVKAHQDKETPIANLTLAAMLNCTADKDAENFRLTASAELQPKLAPPELPLTKAYL